MSHVKLSSRYLELKIPTIIPMAFTWDRHPSQQHAGNHHALWHIQQEVTRPKVRFKPTQSWLSYRLGPVPEQVSRVRRGAVLGEVGQNVEVASDRCRRRLASRLLVENVFIVWRRVERFPVFRRHRSDANRRLRRRRHRRQVEVDGEVRPWGVLPLDVLEVERNLKWVDDWRYIKKVTWLATSNQSALF